VIRFQLDDPHDGDIEVSPVLVLVSCLILLIVARSSELVHERPHVT
jgi:hypothetical protein